MLCEECVKASHRLFLCGTCGEMAIPLVAPQGARAPRTTTEARRVGARTAEYSLGEAFLYPFRGTGAMVFWVYFVLLVIFDVLPAFIPGFGCAVWLPSIIVGLLVPRLLFTIVRTTAEGENELPDWPEFDFWERLADAFWMAVILVVVALPGIVILELSGCDMLTLVGVGDGRSCWPPLILAFFVGMALWIPTLGAYSVFDSFWLIPRIDLHLRAHLTAVVEGLTITFLLAGLFLVSWSLRFAFSFAVPYVGLVLAVFIGIYTFFTGAHLVGVFFRRHFDALERLYIG
jgi:hypothetical protein